MFAPPDISSSIRIPLFSSFAIASSYDTPRSFITTGSTASSVFFLKSATSTVGPSVSRASSIISFSTFLISVLRARSAINCLDTVFLSPSRSRVLRVTFVGSFSILWNSGADPSLRASSSLIFFALIASISSGVRSCTSSIRA